MKQVPTLLFLLLIPFISVAQSQDWKQIESPFSTSIHVVHQTSQGYLFGKMNYTGQSFFSDDRGQNWRELPAQFGEIDQRKFTVREDINGNLFYASDAAVFSFNHTNFDIQQIISVGPFNLLDFAILDDGNIVLATSRNLSLYSVAGDLIHQHPWWTHTADFLLDKEGDRHFVLNSIGSNDKIVEFNADLSFIGPTRETDAYPDMVRKGQRFYRGKQYSEDGVTWQNLEIPTHVQISKNSIGHDGQLFFVAQNTLYISLDDGSSFILNYIPLKSANYISSDLSGEIVASQNDLNKPEFYLSNNHGDSWQSVAHDKGVPFMLGFTAGLDENLYTDNILSYYDYSYKVNEFSPWKQSDFPQGQYYRHFLALSNGSVAALSNDGKIYETPNKGEAWQQKSDYNFGSFYGIPPEEKDGILYFYNKDKLHYSQDYGENWDILTEQDPLLGQVYDETVYPAANYGAYFRTTDTDFSHVLIYYNFQSGERVQTIERSDISPYATSYADETLYGLQATPDMMSLCMSKDFGESYQCKEIPGINTQYYRSIKTDHLGNVYVYTDKEVFYSSDEGDSWFNITPDFPEIYFIKDLQVSYDNFIYVSTVGKGILKYNVQMANSPLRTIEASFESLSIAPNPANEQIKIAGEFLSEIHQNLHIYDIHGRLLNTQNVSQSDNQIDISRLTPGTYMLMITSGNKVYRGKVVKM